MTIRPAVAADVPEIVEMGMRFGKQSTYREHITLSATHLRDLAERLIVVEDGTIVVAQGAGGDLIGMIALHAFEHPMSGELVVLELAWWVEPAARGRAGILLLRAAEKWAQSVGASILQMVAPNAEVEHFYESIGMVPVERTFQRRV